MAWVSVTEDEARQHPFHGFGGWLWGLYAVELFGLGMTLYSVLQVVRLVGVEELTKPSIAGVWLHLLLGMLFLILAPLRARAMPPGVPVDLSTVAPMLAWTAWGVVYTAYLLGSRRVNVTYRHRVRADDAEALAAGAPPA